jgi:hypothetical protein
MDISIHAKISCSDGPCGQATRVILKPTSEEITHLVVSNESFPEIEYLVSIDQVAGSTTSQIRLNCSRAELSNMAIFSKVEFVPSFLTNSYGSPYMMSPYYAPVSKDTLLGNEHLPAGELAIRRGARVEAVDGHMGRVDEFLINPGNDQITHLVMREGHLWGQKDVTIPVDQIDHYKDNTVYLKLHKHDIEKIPGVPVQHGRVKADQGDQNDPKGRRN